MPSGQPYFGYYLNGATTNPASSQYFALPALTEDTWSLVRLYWDAGGNYAVYIDGVKRESQANVPLADTSITFRLGAFGSGDVGVMPFHRFDDVELSVKR